MVRFPRKSVYNTIMRSLICLALTGHTIAENLQSVSSYRGSIDLVEIRADFLESSELASLDKFPHHVNLPVILTVRRKQDGGHFHGQEGDRLKLLKRASAGYSYADLEEDLNIPELEASLRETGCRIIRSMHDVNGVPRDLAARIRKLMHHADEIPKAAVMIRSSEEFLMLLRSIKEMKEMDNQEKILIGMGETGLPTRVLASRFGSMLTFCSIPEKESAPGQVDPHKLNNLYRFKTISDDTRVFGVIGNPINHSLSPVIHNRGFEQLGINAVYLPFLVDDIRAFMQAAEILDIQGVSVTIPHKQGIISCLSEKDNSLESIGACNTLVRKQSGWYGTNTDVMGFLEPLYKRHDRIHSGLKAAVIGAGGAARAVVYALVKEGVKPLILNRTLSKAQDLAEEFGCRAAALSRIDLLEQHSDLIIQTTPAGMEPDTDTDPLPDYRFKGTETVYELIYKPLLTRFLSRAQSAGCTIISGREMLDSQAEAQFKLFTGQDYPK